MSLTGYRGELVPLSVYEVSCDVVTITETMHAAVFAFVCILLYFSSSASESPNFTLHSLNQSVTEGGTATFTCHVDSEGFSEETKINRTVQKQNY